MRKVLTATAFHKFSSHQRAEHLVWEYKHFRYKKPHKLKILPIFNPGGVPLVHWGNCDIAAKSLLKLEKLCYKTNNVKKSVPHCIGWLQWTLSALFSHEMRQGEQPLGNSCWGSLWMFPCEFPVETQSHTLNLNMNWTHKIGFIKGRLEQLIGCGCGGISPHSTSSCA